MKNREYHISFGIHSQIPKCCVMFFVDEWDANEMWLQESPIVEAINASGAEYVQCPECLKRKSPPIDIVICEKDCGGDHHGDFE